MKYHVCSKCGENLTSFKDIDIQMSNVYKKYREIKNLLQPEEIKEIRNKYGISAELFSKILGLGRKTITTYENGVFQTKANDMLIRQSADKNNFIKMFELRRNDLSEKEIQIIERNLKNQVNIFSSNEYECSAICNCICHQDLTTENNQLKAEIEQLKENDRITKALYKNYYTQLQNYKNKIYEIDVKKLMSKKLTSEQKELYYKGFANCETQIAANVADITIKIRKQICDELRQKLKKQIIPTAGTWLSYYDVQETNDLIDKIEEGE